ncbi:polyprenyl synthetase family protein [Streptomyces sp. NPDC017546]|uniref:polyprenyl synthetase family protein n=1 Tax=unclassified Streptomyces TaxID=2593676 RepID=UPI00235EDB8A|nr:polyprenyl synthetase family protein [Streptomyces sp. MMBL 11-1]
MDRPQPTEHSFGEPSPSAHERDGHRHPVPSAEDPRVVDPDVADALLRTARAVLAERVLEASRSDALFSEELARRVADFTLDGGKRTRPRLLWWAMRACGAAETTAALRLGVALELIQTCALIHDDVMDRSRLRRGRPAMHIGLAERAGLRPESGRGFAFGSSAAVLAGDLALVWADDTVAETVLSADQRRRVGTLWRAMRTEMVAGQYLDLRGQVSGGSSTARALRTARLKSASYSVERPLALGAALAGADERTTDALRAAGRSAGIAFQLRDDLLGVFGDPALTGKPSGDDVREGKPTYLLAVARTWAEAAGDEQALAVLGRVTGDADLTEEDLVDVRGVLDATGARAHVERAAERLHHRAVRRLGQAVDVDAHGGRQLLGLLRTVSGDRSGHFGAAPGGTRHDGGSAAATRVLTSAEGGDTR